VGHNKYLGIACDLLHSILFLDSMEHDRLELLRILIMAYGNFSIQISDPTADFSLKQELTDLTRQNIIDYSITKFN